MHRDIYKTAALYDLAFSYRDFSEECTFLRKVFARCSGRTLQSFLEIAAGPGRHAHEMLASGIEAVAMDLVPEMAMLSQNRARERGLALPYFVADMTRFGCSRQFDLAACMLCSATYLLTDCDFVAHLECVHQALLPDGRYVLELPHPSHDKDPKTKDTWSVQDEGGVLDVEWLEHDAGRGAQATFVARARLEYRPHGGGAPIVVTDEAPQRSFSLAELQRLATEAGFSVQATFGALDENIGLDDASAWRMIVVLQKAL